MRRTPRMKSQIVNDLENQRVINNYKMGVRSPNLSDQMQAVHNMMEHFSKQDEPEVDHIFIENFPNGLYEKFQIMSKIKNYARGTRTEKILLFEIFTFIFRNTNLFRNPMAQTLLEVFLKFIKFEEGTYKFKDVLLLNSVNCCISYEPNRVLFIHENGLFNILYVFNLRKINRRHRFWKLCKQTKIKECIEKIMSKLLIEKIESSARILFAVLMMIYRTRMLEDFELNVTQLYDVTKWILLYYATKDVYPTSLFSIHISKKFDKALKKSVLFELTKNQKQRLYILYLAIVAFSLIESILNYYVNDRTDDLPLQHHFHIVQFFIKSITLIESHDVPEAIKIFRNFFSQLSTYKSLTSKLILESPLVMPISEISKIIDIDPIDFFPSELIKALSDEAYVYKLKYEQCLYLYEDIKGPLLSNFDDNFIKSIFSACESDINTIFESEMSENSEQVTIIYEELLSILIKTFNESSYIDANKAIQLMIIYDNVGGDLVPTSCDPENRDVKPKSSANSNESDCHSGLKNIFTNFLRWFVLIYQQKFIFGDVDSKFTNIHF
ncbi:hypothetical protein RF11_09959 [Thelohanellus kitauei]|uniref:Uncharacterized protein n=1 Tax=Thelohanellus kitauei TaxID=669202 RepID=A0A0C2N550_THEKT|nr:hypothetical protein RF11_09959 [Thelohanellus kitauei]